MVAIPAITGMRLGQPVGGRRNWPSAAREGLDPVDVQAFCLDAQPRSRASVEPEAYDTAGVSQCERFLLARDKPAERTCLDRDEAERICATTTPGGHLPTLVEWESAARAHAGDLALPTQEWAGERFPPAVLRRVDPAWDRGDGMWVGQLSPDRAPADPEASLLLAWNQQAPGNRKVERGFRCAAPFLDRH
jgi:formylglycine-generating enzyme required for sulfatase activity